MFLRARPTALTLLLGGTLMASTAHAAPWDNWFSSDSDQNAAQLGPKRVPEQNAGDRTSAEALNFNGAQPHAAGAGGFDMPQPQVQGMIDQPSDMAGPGSMQAPSTPIFPDSSLSAAPASNMQSASVTQSAPMTSSASTAAPAEEPGFGDRFLSWAGLAPQPKQANPALADIHMTDQVSGAPGAMPTPSAQQAASVEYYDANGYPILSTTPDSPMRPDLAAKTAEAHDLSNTNQTAEATRQRFMDQGENAFAPTPAQQAYQPAPLDAPLPTGPVSSGSYAGSMNAPEPGSPMDELAFNGTAAPAARAVPSPSESSGRQAVNAPDAAQYASAPEPLRASRLSDAPLDAPPMLASAPPASIDLMAPDSPAPQPTPQMAMVPMRSSEPASRADAPLQAYASMQQPAPMAPTPPPAAMTMESMPARPAEPTAPASRNDTAEAAAEAITPTPEMQNRPVANRAPANLASGSAVQSSGSATQSSGYTAQSNQAQPIPASGAPIPLPPAIAAFSSDYGEKSAAGEVPVAAPGTPGANRVSPLRYLPESRYAERRGVKTADTQ